MEVHVESKKHNPVYKARKKRVVRGVVATYLRELSAAGRREPVPEPAKA
jgi:hypothetical protein